MSKVIIIGAGLSGTLTAIHLLKAGLNIIHVEKESGQIGRGVAYALQSPHHLLNVRAFKMSLFAEQPNDFSDWLRANKIDYQEQDFVPRKIFGDYSAWTLNEAVSRSQGSYEQLEAEVSTLKTENGKVKATFKDGKRIFADHAVLAIGNLPPKNLAPLNNVAHFDRYYSNPWKLPQDYYKNAKSICIIGSGLTAVDVIINLLNSSYAGKIVCISRRGLLPQPHTSSLSSPTASPFLHGTLSKKIREFTRWLRNETIWQNAFDCIRPQTSRLWQELTVREKQSFIRHLLPYWDTHRHRMAPELNASIKSALKDAQLKIVAARIVEAKIVNSHLELSLQNRSSRDTSILATDLLINCTGPSSIASLDSALLRQLLNDNLAIKDELGIGLLTDDEGRLVGQDKNNPPNIWTIGSARKGSLWESNALMEIREQARELANSISLTINRSTAIANQRS